MKQLRFSMLLFTFLMAGQILSAQNTGLRQKQYNLTKGVGIEGYDPVAYFTQKKAVKGNKSTAVSYAGVIYWFSSSANKELFLKNPSAYEPQYGGWCAYAMGNTGEKVEVDPETFKIINGKLYLFYNAYFNNTLITWNKNETNLKNKADKNWQNFYQ